LTQKRYNFLLTNGLNRVRLRELDEGFTELLRAEEEFPAQLPDMKDLYTDFYNEMTELTKNIVCIMRMY
jgi:Lon protease-like protein